MKTLAVISFTESGRRLSRRIQDMCADLDIQRFCFHTHTDCDAVEFSDTSALAAQLFHRFDGLVFVCACGIAVRTIAPLIVSKQTDPAVIVADECGKFVIPILSGHLGGANALAKHLADKLDAQAVITTATDIGGKFSPDSFASANDLLIENLDAAKMIAATVLAGETIGLVCDYAYVNLPDAFSADMHCNSGLYIGTNPAFKPFPVTLRLTPKNVVLGLGCRRGISAQEIERAVTSALYENDIALERVCKAASIDRKADEQGIIEFCRKYRLPFYTYSAEALAAVDGNFSASEFVKQTTGVENVCERSAVRCSSGTLIMPKTARTGVTVAAAEKPVLIDFERTIL